MTQWNKIAKYIEDNGSITSLDGFRIGCTKVTTRISEMRRAGYKFIEAWEEATNTDGEKVRFKRYRLVTENE